MTTTELNQAMSELSDAFPTVKKRLIESPRALSEWQKALRGHDAATVSYAISRWLHTHHTDPVLEKFLDLIDALTESQQQQRSNHRVPDTQPVGDMVASVMRDALGGAQNDDDRAWGRLHYAMYAHGYATDTPDNAVIRARMYRTFAEKYPALAGLALRCATQCDDAADAVPF